MERVFPRESEEGNVEYKLKLAYVSEGRLEELASQLRYRLAEKGGEAFYVLGVSNEGEPIGLSDEEVKVSLENLKRVAEKAGAKINVIREASGKRGKIVEVLVRRCRETLPVQVSVIAVGHADHGKTTTVGVLVTGELDDGDGAVMSKVARYKHEIQMRRTSSVAERLLGFDDEGRVVNYMLTSPLDEASVFLNSSKIVSFIDVGGHERYLRTAAKGLLSHSPDYALLIVAANAGVSQMTKEHLGIALSFRIPVFVAITKTDMVPRERVQEVLNDVIKLLKMPGVNKIPLVIEDVDDVAIAAKNMPSGRVSPIFKLSNRTGEGLDLLRTFLNLLPPRLRWKENLNKPFLLYIDEKFNVPGVGVVVSGLVLQGHVAVDDYVQLGPFRDGSFRSVRIRSIHVRKGVFADSVSAGMSAAFALSNVGYDEIEKGMVLLDKKIAPKAIRKIEAEVFVLHHPTTIKPGYECTFHIHAIRESGKFIQMSKPYLRSGDLAKALIEFRYKPVYVYPGQRFLFREAHTRGVGIILNAYS
ncbi:MAG: elongation factor 1-alpha [Candidatus Methanomethylicota archaeon]|uniref:Elongation factor 1-alpha n=1 Tax=Thermoproteota archaeon TaxID=2056631 RepID=A0A497EV80_9CREN|nr:MAG: elongation factor 1-alpha [Candidatus Verstraetearchaeota archaeon]